MVERFERFSLAISEISRCWHKLAAEEMAKYGLKGPLVTYLVTISRHPAGLTAPQLCELCGKDKSDVSRMMALMEQKGLVKKESVHQNRYGGVFRLTPAGEEAASFVRQRAGTAVELAGGTLSEAERTIFYNALESIAANLKQIAKDGLPEPPAEANK